jgi:hypothetical protein
VNHQTALFRATICPKKRYDEISVKTQYRK